MTRRLVTVVLLAAALAGCSSGVPLNDVPVEDRTGTAVQPGTPGGGTAGQGTQSAVPTVRVDPNANNAAGPVNTTRLVYFDYDSYVVKADSQATVEAHARFLKANPQRKVALEGHTDDRGGREYNLALGQRRAEAVRRALSLLGVADTQMEAVSFGKEKPAMVGNDEAAWAQNRRVEISYR